MDLFFYFIFGAFIFFTVFSYLFFSRLVIIRLLQQGSRRAIIAISTLFFTILFVSIQYFYIFFESFFSVEPLWQAKLYFFILFVGALFLIIKIVLPEVSSTIPTKHFQDMFIVTGRPIAVFENYKKILKVSGAEILLQSPEALFFIIEMLIQEGEKQQKYVVEIKIKPCFWSRSSIDFLCYPAQRGVFIEKKDFQKVISALDPLMLVHT